MMIIDTSALMAIVLQEPERDIFLAALASVDETSISAATMIETQMVCFSRGGAILVAEVEALVAAFGISIEPVNEDQLTYAHQAFVTYGKGQGHPAQLNFGDLFSYALAKVHDAPLLFKGDDFAATDITPALTP